MRVQRTGWKALFKEWSIAGDGALVLVFVTMRGGEIGAVHGTIDGDFALVPQHTAQIFSPFAGQKRSAFFFSQIGTRQKIPLCEPGGKNTVRPTKYKMRLAIRP